MNAIEIFIKSIADWTVDVPTFYGWFHLVWLGITAVSCAVVFAMHGKISQKAVDITLIVWGTALILLEIIKQLLCSFHYDGQTVTWSYGWWVFPFQFCSCPLYLALPAGIIRKGKVKDALLSFLASYALFGGLVALVYPANMFTTSGFLSMHTMLWHSSMVVICTMLFASGAVKPTFKKLLSATVIFIILATIAVILNVIVSNCTDISGFNMFFISPYESWDVPIVKLIFDNVPYPVYLMLYLLGFFAAAGLVFLTARGIAKIYRGKEICEPNEENEHKSA